MNRKDAMEYVKLLNKYRLACLNSSLEQVFALRDELSDWTSRFPELGDGYSLWMDYEGNSSASGPGWYGSFRGIGMAMTAVIERLTS